MLHKTIIILLLSFFLSHTITAQQDECPQFEWVEGITIKRDSILYPAYDAPTITRYDKDGNIYIILRNIKSTMGIFPNDTLYIGKKQIPIPIPFIKHSYYGFTILKLDAQYNLLWYQYAYTGRDNPASRLLLDNMQLDSRGNVYVTGKFYNNNVPDTFRVGNKQIIGNVLNTTQNQSVNGFLVKLNGKTGDAFWIKQFVGISPFGFEMSQTDKLYIAMYAGHDTVSINNQQFFGQKLKTSIAQFNALGELQWINWGEQYTNFHFHVYITGGDYVSHINHILTIDNDDNVYTFIHKDSAITKINSTGQVMWERNYNFIKNNVRVSNIHVSQSNILYLTLYGPMNTPELKVDFGNGDTVHISEYMSTVLWGLETNGGQTAFASVLWDNPSDSTYIYTTNLKSDNMGYVYIAAYILTKMEDTSYIGDSAIVVTLANNNITYGSRDAFVAKVLPPAEGMGKVKFIWSLHTSGARGEVIYLSKVEDSGGEMYFFNLVNGWFMGSGDAILGQHRFTGDSSHNYFGKINTDCSLPTEEISNPLQSVTIYPNPANTNITITNLPLNSTIHITDISGRVLYTQYNKSNSTAQLPLNGISNGMYFVQIINGENMVNRKVVVQQ